MISHSRPCLDENDCQAVLDVLRSGCLVQGEIVAALEDAFALFMSRRQGSSNQEQEDVGTTSGNNQPAAFREKSQIATHVADRSGVLPECFHAAAVSTGTAALHLTLLGAGIGPGDEVIIPSYVCTALWHAVIYTGATPILADCKPDTFNIDAEDVKQRCTDRTRAVIVPHLFGQAADLDDILALGIPVIEDCAQSLGSTYRERPTGSFGIAGIFSFYATKVIAAGEGGMVVSRNASLIEKIRICEIYDEKDVLATRYNYKLTDIQAALALSQFYKLPSFIARRRILAAQYDRVLIDNGIIPPIKKDGREHIFYRYVFLVDALETFINEMARRRVSCRRPVFQPLHNYLKTRGYAISDHLWQHAVSVPLYPGLTAAEMDTVTAAMKAGFHAD